MSKLLRFFLVLITIIVVTLILPQYYRIVFILKHISIFLVIGLLVLKIVSISYNSLIMDYKDILVGMKLILFNVFTLLIIIVILVGVRWSQLRFIDYFETPTVVTCYYYDERGNFIHSSTFSSMCSDLEIIEESDNSLNVRAKYEFPDINDSEWSRSNDDPYMNIDGAFAVTEVYIDYTDLGLIDYYQTQTSANYTLKRKDNNEDEDYWVETGYYSIQVVYDYEYFEDKVHLTIERYSYEEETSKYEGDNIVHYNFSNVEPEYIKDVRIETYNINDYHVKTIGYDIYVDDISYINGQISIENGSINILLDYYKQSITPIESEQVIIDDDMIYRVFNFTKPFGGTEEDMYVVRELRYQLDNNLYNLLSTTQFPDSIKHYNVRDKKVIKDKFGESIIEKTDIGYKVEVYQSDGYFEEKKPYSYELFNGYRIRGDVSVLGINEPNYFSNEYESIFRLDPLLEYFVMKLK